MTATATAPYRMRLRKIHIRDFRGIDELELDFTGPDGRVLDTAVIAGENGCGKTSVLEAILALLGREDLLSRHLGDADNRFGGNGHRLTGEVHHPSVTEGEAEVLPLEYKAPFGMVYWRPNWDPPEIEYYSALRVPLINQPVELALGLFGTRSRPESARLADLRNRLISSFYRGLREAQRPSGAPPLASLPFERLQEWWHRFNPNTQLDVIPASNDPGSGDEVIVRDADRPIPLDITSLTMARAQAPSRTDIPSMVPMDRLSSGQLSMLAFAGPIVFRDQPPDLVLIDEPEQHLHVRWQREVLPALRALSPQTQYIVATHSEEILDAATSYERFILVGEDDPRAALGEQSPSPGDAE